MRSTRKKQRTSYREMTDHEWFVAMEKAEKEQFKDEYTPSHEVAKLSTRILPLESRVDGRNILRKSSSSKYDYATSKSS